MSPLHQQLAAERWFTMTLMEQLGNIGSEVGRVIKREHEGHKEARDRALDRALELFDLTIADPRWKNRLKEILRAREVVCDVFYGDNTYHTSLNSLEKYFLQFGYAARLG